MVRINIIMSVKIIVLHAAFGAMGALVSCGLTYGALCLFLRG